MTNQKQKIAVFFGGVSPEHDVSVVSGLQVLKAIDSTRFDAFPVYVDPDGVWLVGEHLRKRDNYLLSAEMRSELTEVTLDVSSKTPALLPRKGKFLGAPKPIEFDVALPVFHGLRGEDGNFQGLFEVAGVPYTGMRTMASANFMDKVTSKLFLRSIGIPVLKFAVLKRPAEGLMIPQDDIAVMVKTSKMNFPMILKPSHLGSSIGVAKVNTVEEIAECLPAIFKYDDAAILEPFVPNLVEYNVAVTKVRGNIETSALERPKAAEELLDFKQKYLSGGDSKTGDKLGGTKSGDEPVSEGMLSLTRELNPKISERSEADIRDWAARAFEAIGGTGAPRIDFIGDEKSGKIWMNEVNPIPGSYGYFLWEAAKEPMLFTGFLTALIVEAVQEQKRRRLPDDPVPAEARLLKR